MRAERAPGRELVNSFGKSALQVLHHLILQVIRSCRAFRNPFGSISLHGRVYICLPSKQGGLGVLSWAFRVKWSDCGTALAATRSTFYPCAKKKIQRVASLMCGGQDQLGESQCCHGHQGYTGHVDLLCQANDTPTRCLAGALRPPCSLCWAWAYNCCLFSHHH